ncbi:MAG TPA: sigma-70 family RNA polymerase sigma factor [Candidatus Tumulicola sp.]
MEAFVARKPTALDQAYALWATLFVSVAHHVVHDVPAAQDCVHDALLRVWRGPNRFSGDREALRAYLTACVRNEALMALRSEARRESREERAARLTPANANDDEVAMVDPIESERLRRALDSLPPEQRRALTLAYYGNKTHVEIAEALDEPLGTIKSRIATALRKVRAELAGAEGQR